MRGRWAVPWDNAVRSVNLVDNDTLLRFDDAGAVLALNVSIFAQVWRFPISLQWKKWSAFLPDG